MQKCEVGVDSTSEIGPPPVDQLLTVKQAAQFLNVSQSFVYEVCATNELSHYKLGQAGKSIRISRTDLDDFLRRCRVEKKEKRVLVLSPVRSKYIPKHLDPRPQHPCGAVTKAGTPCTRMTRDKRCPQHQMGRNGASP